MTIRTIPAGVIALSLGVAPLSASNGKPPVAHGGNPHLTTTTKPSAPTSKTTTQTSHGNPHATTTTPTKSTSSTKHSSPAGTTPTTTSSTTTLNPIAQKIASKPKLSSKLQAMLPTGMTLNQASLGFKNQGQFIAALHVSQNLGIPFADLKTAMTGINPNLPPGTTQTSTSTMSLGQAIQKLRPTADADGATETAEHEASTDLSRTTTQTATTPTATTPTATTPTTTTAPKPKKTTTK
jgi:hypothetical protein